MITLRSSLTVLRSLYPVFVIVLLLGACGGKKDAPKSEALAVPEVKGPGGDGPHAEFARFWSAVLDGNDGKAVKFALKGAESEANVKGLIHRHQELLATEKAVEDVLGEVAAKDFYENDLRATYFNSVAKGIEFAKEEIARDGNSAIVRVERPEKNFSFTMKKEDGDWRLETWAPNRLEELMGTAMGRLRPRVKQGFYKSGGEAYSALNADLFKRGLPGNYEMQVSQDGEWMHGNKGIQVRVDPAGDLKAGFFDMREKYQEEGARIPEEDCRLPIFAEGQDFYFDEVFMGWGRYAFRAGDYQWMMGQNLHPYGNATAIRLKFLSNP